MVIVLDITVAVVLILTSIIGWNKGFIRFLVGSLGTIAAIALAFLLADIAAPSVYEKFVQKPVRDYISQRIEHIDVVDMISQELKNSGYNVDISDEQIKSVLEQNGDIVKALTDMSEKTGQQAQKLEIYLDDFFEKRFPEKFNKAFTGIDTQKLSDVAKYTKDNAYETVRALADNNTQQGAEYIEQHTVKPFAVTAVKIALFIALFIVMSIVVKLILKAAGVFDHIPVANGANKFLGLIVGFAKGILYLSVIALCFCVLIKSCGDSMNQINTTLIDKTVLFKYFFDFWYK